MVIDELLIRMAMPEDSQVIADIYNYYVENSMATFDLEFKSVDSFRKEIESIIPELPYYVAEYKDEIVAYAYAAPWKRRKAYQYSVESSVYIKVDFQEKGIGSMLYSKVIDDLKLLDVHSVIGGISLPNEVSEKLHEKFGFEKVAHFKEVGYKFNKWIDVGYWQLFLNKE